MNPLWVSIVVGIVRWLLTGVATWLVNQGIIKPDQTTQFYTGIALAVLSLGWTLWSRYKTRLHFLTGLALPPGSTADDVKAVVASGQAPKATTPNSVAPRLGM